MSRKLFFVLLIASIGLTACRAARVLVNGPAPANTAIPIVTTPAREAATPPPTVTQPAPRTPVPTLDFRNLLLTQAYAFHTPRPSRTSPPEPTSTSMPNASSNTSITVTQPTTAPQPAAVYFTEPVNIPNAITKADCKIRGVGDCTATMAEGTDTYFTWTFGVDGSGSFSWGQAAVVIARDGQQVVWTQVGNGLQRPPGTDRGWVLRVGQKAEFRAGMENLQPGFYTARLAMCLLSPNECNAGSGWITVGGESIQFRITQ